MSRRRDPERDATGGPAAGPGRAGGPAAEYLTAWSQRHGGVVATGLVGRWVLITRALASPLARVAPSPDLISLAGVAVALLATVPASGGGRWLIAAAVLVAGSGLLDGLDGAVALLTGRGSAWGAVLDSGCDRLAEAGFALALVLAGGPARVTLIAVGIGWLHEYLRARAGAVGMAEVGVVTVAERPTRVIIVTMTLLAAGVLADQGPFWLAAGASAWAVVGAVGLVQLLVAIRRRLGRAGQGRG